MKKCGRGRRGDGLAVVTYIASSRPTPLPPVSLVTFGAASPQLLPPSPVGPRAYLHVNLDDIGRGGVVVLLGRPHDANKRELLLSVLCVGGQGRCGQVCVGLLYCWTVLTMPTNGITAWSIRAPCRPSEVRQPRWST